MTSEFDTISQDKLICPYCGCEQEDAREQEDWGTPENWECSDCCKDFVYTTETVLKFSSERLDTFLEEKIFQESHWLNVLEHDFNSIRNDETNCEERRKKADEKIERTRNRLKQLQERFDNFVKNHCLEEIENA